MDKSKKYIEMCEKAEKIQQLWQPNAGDWFLEKSTLPLEIIIFEGWYVLRKDKFIQRIGPANNYDFFDKGKVEIWLPRQDQLQEMIIDDFDDVQDMFYNFSRWIYNEPCETAEQLWLAFVMAEKFDKVWNGRRWIYESKKTANQRQGLHGVWRLKTLGKRL